MPEKDVYELFSTCVCCGISPGGRTGLHPLSSQNVNADTYRDGILD
ncbi:hypothetical protein TNCV_4687611, partial [Trichonephila clavipes]